ncbi:3-oxoacyl-[acyl-carrier-protein] synthase, mitochondrial isoform X2 [Musa acuminata AAA Group]|uniref:3-oxoacyl-[acyl-carrier-protein] synthase, mitochondrial isoform X2 n=1 Tax=Musa acuminata AAA Group TaxID=214697 RepID=UPI0031CF4F1E
MEALRRITRRPIRRRFLSSQAFDPPPAAPRRRVVVTGLGMVTPLGCGVGETWRRLVDERCGVRALTPADLRMDGFDEATVMHTYDQLTAKVAAIVPCGKGEGKFDEEQWLQSKDHRSTSRFIAYALCSTEEALRDANWLPTEPEKKERTGVSIGGGIGSISDILDAAQLICDKGPNHAAVTACATGAHSIGDATRMIQFGDADVMVAGGTESSIDALSIAGFCRSRALATKYNLLPQVSSRPFDCDRDGFVIGEGSGVMVLEELNHAKERGAKIYAEVRGYGMSGDAYHITQPHIDGKGAILAMTRALEQSGLHPNQVDYINAHATSTPLGDAAEANAIKSVFSDHATSGALALSSTKGATGHLLGAAGSVEAIFSVLAICHGIAPPTLNLLNPDPVFHDGYLPLSTSTKMQIRAALSNSFGFGGTNASLLFACPPT